MSLIDLADRFITDFHPRVDGALLGGSVVAGNDTPTSDLDIVLLFPSGNPNYAETVSYEGRLVEVFAHTPESIASWNQREAAERRPILASLCAHSLVLRGSTMATKVQTEARALLAAGSAPLTPAENDALRYALSAELDDLRGASSPAERFAIHAQVFGSAAELLLQLEGVWLGKGKWLVRQLTLSQDPLAARLIRWAASAGTEEDLDAIGTAVLGKAGGRLQEGHIRGSKAR
jgi:hypothetical protein